MKRKILAIMLVIAATLSMVACSGMGSPDGPEKVTITIVGNKSDLEKSYIVSIFKQYEEATGNRLDITEIDDAEFEAEAAKLFESGNIPDVFMHFNNAALNNFDVANNFYYLNDESWVDDLTDGSKAYCQDAEGNILGLPFWESSVSGCYYNKTILDELGLKPATTQAEFDVLCQALTDIGYTPICWPAECAWMYQFGLDPVFADDLDLLEKLNRNEITYSEIPEVTDMVQWIADAAGKGWFGHSYKNTGWSDISPIMASGEAVMVFIWDTWFYTDFEEGNKYTREDFALMPVFMDTADNGTYEGGNLEMLMVNKNSEQIDAALEFLEFCATPENYNVAFDGISTVNCFKGQTTNIQSPMVTDAMTSINANQRVSTTVSKVVGYSQSETASAFQELFKGKADVEGCVRMMDEYRINGAKSLGIEGF